MSLPDPFRKTTQRLAPVEWTATAPGRYDIYPTFPLGGPMGVGYDALAEKLAGEGVVVLDGYGGVLWDHLRESLDAALRRRGVSVVWCDARVAMRPPEEIERLLEPYLGGDDPLFGTRYPGGLEDFFDLPRLRALLPDSRANLSIIYGPGAAMAGWSGSLVYVDLPRNEYQFRARAGCVVNLGASEPTDAGRTYKRAYFVDWVVLNKYRAKILPQLDWMVDGQRPEEMVFARASHVRDALARMGRSCFRVRPWFEPGPWGGQWIREHIPDLPRDVPNYAWSFELISPENGLLLESDGRMLEIGFDLLMAQERARVLGEFAADFGSEFPIRFDFLDTFDGGNLSVQCHPHPDFIRENFGERITQDETYYILDTAPGAEVYLGFREGTDPQAFRAELERSQAEGRKIDAERFVHKVPASKHDLFLIPHGTIHCSGRDNLVLEISSTPYIFTFKMYDWMRRDLSGKFRPLNIERAFANLRFERMGERVERELVSHPSVLQEGEGWRVMHLPTHADHFYDEHRYEFEREVERETAGSPHVMNVVEGQSVLLETATGERRFNYAETFVVPAATGRYRLIPEGGPAKVVKALIKPEKRGKIADRT